jgi:hypothetical protein
VACTTAQVYNKSCILDEMFFEPVVRKAQLYPKILKEQRQNVCRIKCQNNRDKKINKDQPSVQYCREV